MLNSNLLTGERGKNNKSRRDENRTNPTLNGKSLERVVSSSFGYQWCTDQVTMYRLEDQI